MELDYGLLVRGGWGDEDEPQPGSQGGLLGNVLRCIGNESRDRMASHRKHTDTANWKLEGKRGEGTRETPFLEWVSKI